MCEIGPIAGVVLHLMNNTQAEYTQNVGETKNKRGIIHNMFLTSQFIDTQFKKMLWSAYIMYFYSPHKTE